MNETRSKDETQLWGPCPKCSGNYKWDNMAGYGMDAFRVEWIECHDCGFKITWIEAGNADFDSAPDYWLYLQKDTQEQL